MIAECVPEPCLAPNSHDPESLCQLLKLLYREQLSVDPDNLYLQSHSRDRAIANQVRTFQWYRKFLPSSGSILDWGCQHAPDSCLLRSAFSDRFALHGCDLGAPERYPCFFDFAGLEYTQLTHSVLLPYSANRFDVVIASGVLEHVSMDYESLKELHRVLKPHGLLIISYLPNWLSINEWFRRVIRRRDFHRRLYGVTETRQLLKRSGFYPLSVDHHTFLWESALARVGLGRCSGLIGRALRTALPVHWFCSTLCAVAKRMEGF